MGCLSGPAPKVEPFPSIPTKDVTTIKEWSQPSIPNIDPPGAAKALLEEPKRVVALPIWSDTELLCVPTIMGRHDHE